MEPKIRERPILFSAPMARAILAGTKTQTRRVVKPPRGHELANLRYSEEDDRYSGRHDDPASWGYPFYEDSAPAALSDWLNLCPYGQPGNRLYVRETWRVGARWDDSKPSDIPPNGCTVLYRAGGFTTNGDNGERIHGGECSNPDWAGKTRTAIHMPRWASRIDLEITGVRVERLNAISEADAAAEGTSCYVCGGPMDGSSEEDCHCFHAKAKPSDFRALWESINGLESWGQNPWVWVIQFQSTKASHGSA